MSTWDAFGGAVLAFAILLGLVGVGFAAGYKGTWKHTLAAVGSIVGLFLFPQIASFVVFHSAPAFNKVLGGTLIFVSLITFGSLVGALARKRNSTKVELIYHASIVGGVLIFFEILSGLAKH